MGSFKFTYDHLINLFVPCAGIVFSILETFFPERIINKKYELKNDLLAFCALLLLGPLFAQQIANLMKPYYIWSTTWISLLPSVVKIVLAVILTDFFNYWLHFCMHKFNWFWRSHLFHHRIQNLYWFSGLRASVTHYMAFIIVRMTVGVLLFKLNSLELFYYFAIGFSFNSFQHTNSKIGLKFIEYLFVTPRVHRLHHAINGRKMKNIGTVFTIWDRVFGTYYDPEKMEKNFKLGIRHQSDVNWKKEFFGV